MRHMGETVKDMLVRQGIEAGRAGNTGRHGKVARTVGAGAASVKGPDPKARPVYREVSTNAQEPSPSREEARPVLRLIVSSRCLDTAQPTRMPRAVVSKHLMLVVSN